MYNTPETTTPTETYSPLDTNIVYSNNNIYLGDTGLIIQIKDGRWQRHFLPNNRASKSHDRDIVEQNKQKYVIGLQLLANLYSNTNVFDEGHPRIDLLTSDEDSPDIHYFNQSLFKNEALPPQFRNIYTYTGPKESGDYDISISINALKDLLDWIDDPKITPQQKTPYVKKLQRIREAAIKNYFQNDPLIYELSTDASNLSNDFWNESK